MSTIDAIELLLENFGLIRTPQIIWGGNLDSFAFITAIGTYALVTSITPGPNNTMLIASGANFGFGSTLPHMLGITFGFSLMLFAVGCGIGAALLSFPPAFRVVQFAGAAYMLYLAWKIANANAPTVAGTPSGRPFTFVQAAAFQWVNPKAWILALGVVSTYLPAQGYFAGLLVACLVFAAVNFPCIAVWAGLGDLLRSKLSDQKLLRVFNWTMAALLVASLYPMLQAEIHH